MCTQIIMLNWFIAKYKHQSNLNYSLFLVSKVKRKMDL